MFVQDFVLNRQGHGPVGQALANVRFDPGFMRPYYDSQDKAAVTINTGRTTLVKGQQVPIREHRRIADLIANGVHVPTFVQNATMLRKEEWLRLDRQVLMAARYETVAWNDLVSRNPYGGFNGMGVMLLEHETMADVGEAVQDMSPITQVTNTAPQFQLEGLPLPITQAGFWLDQRKLMISRNSGMPLNTSLAEMCGRRVMEMVEKVTIGNNTGVTYGGNSTQTGGYGRTSKVYGYTNFTNRLTKTNLTAPTGSNPETTVAEVLAMKDQLVANKYRGPWMLYHSNDWDQYMDNDYARLGGNNASLTLRERLKKIGGIVDVKRLDMLFATVPQTNPYWTSSTQGTTGQQIYRGPGGEGIGTPGASANPFTLLMVQQTPDVAQGVVGMDLTTIMWESLGGARIDFKVMAILVPWLKADHYGNCGILHASTS